MLPQNGTVPERRKRVRRIKRFTVAQVTALCGGKLPYGKGFAWERVEHFLLEEGVLQPYSGKNILPGPGITLFLQIAEGDIPAVDEAWYVRFPHTPHVAHVVVEYASRAMICVRELGFGPQFRFKRGEIEFLERSPQFDR